MSNKTKQLKDDIKNVSPLVEPEAESREMQMYRRYLDGGISVEDATRLVNKQFKSNWNPYIETTLSNICMKSRWLKEAYCKNEPIERYIRELKHQIVILEEELKEYYY